MITTPPTPQPRSQMVAFVVSELSSSDKEEMPSYCAVPSTPSLARHARTVADKLKEGAENILESRHAAVRYSFIPPDSCSEDGDSDDEPEEDDWARNKILKQLPKEIFRDIKRPSDFQRLEMKPQNKINYSTSIIKDLTKVKMSILSPTTTTTPYSVFYNNQSSESLNSSQTFPLPDRNDSLPNNTELSDLPGCTESRELSELSELSNPSHYHNQPQPHSLITKSDSEFTFQSYSCSSRASTLSSQYREVTDNLVDLTEETHETEDEASTISGYDSLEYLNILDTSLSLSNPHYSGPQITQEDNHSSYAEALKCTVSENGPTMSEGVQMREKRVRQGGVRPKSEMVSTNFVTEKTRPLSEVGCGDSVNMKLPQLVMYVVGGREVGQVNVFNRNISIWKLRI